MNITHSTTSWKLRKVNDGHTWIIIKFVQYVNSYSQLILSYYNYCASLLSPHWKKVALWQKRALKCWSRTIEFNILSIIFWNKVLFRKKHRFCGTLWKLAEHEFCWLFSKYLAILRVDKAWNFFLVATILIDTTDRRDLPHIWHTKWANFCLWDLLCLLNNFSCVINVVPPMCWR